MANPSPDKGNITDAEIAGFMGWRGPGAYTAAQLRNIRRIIDCVLERATPPSPSTAPEVDEMIEVVSDFRKATYEFARGQDPSDHALMMDRQKRIFEIFRSALASRPAGVDDEGLPPLPAPLPLDDHTARYSAEQYRQGQRDAVAADRARRKAGGGEK